MLNGFLLLLMALAEIAPVAETFDRSKNAFGRGDYSRTIETLRPLLEPEVRLESESQVVEAHKMLGESYLFEKQNDLAAREFRRLLQVRPDYRFDPLLDPPQVVDFFSALVREHESELATLEAKRRQAAQERAQKDVKIVETHYVRHSYALNFLPFGAGQFQNGQAKKGWAFFAAESALGAISMGSFVTNLALYGLTPRRGCRVASPCPTDQIDNTDENRSKLLLRVQVASGALFFGTVAWGIIDAIRNFEQIVPAASPPAVKKAAFAPMLFPGSAPGPSLAFRF